MNKNPEVQAGQLRTAKITQLHATLMRMKGKTEINPIKKHLQLIRILCRKFQKNLEYKFPTTSAQEKSIEWLGEKATQQHSLPIEQLLQPLEVRYKAI